MQVRGLQVTFRQRAGAAQSVRAEGQGLVAQPVQAALAVRAERAVQTELDGQTELLAAQAERAMQAERAGRAMRSAPAPGVLPGVLRVFGALRALPPLLTALALRAALPAFGRFRRLAPLRALGVAALAGVLGCGPGLPAAAQEQAGATPAAPAPQLIPLPAEGLTVEQFRWEKRLVVVLADSPQNPAFGEQMRNLAEDPAALDRRDVVVITDTDPGTPSAIRARLRPHGFALVLIDKDGQIAQRKPLPWTVREIVAAIDKMPLRQEEIRSGREGY